MKGMKSFLRRKWLICIVPSVLLTSYCGSYLYLRHTHYSIHRAGEYADPPTNHYIQPGSIFGDGADIPTDIRNATIEELQGSGRGLIPRRYRRNYGRRSRKLSGEESGP